MLMNRAGIGGWVLAVVFAAAGAANVRAGEPPAPNDVRWQEARCPVCRKVGRVGFLTPPDVFSGIDSDLFFRAVGPQPEFYLIDTCPVCYFSGYVSDFDLVLPDKVKEELRKTLKPAHSISPSAKQQEIETLDKYELAWQTFSILGRSDEAFAWLAIRASWVARDLYSVMPKHPEVAKVLVEAGKLLGPPKASTNPAEREVLQARKLELLAQGLPSGAKNEWSYKAVIALLYRRHGENSAAEPYIHDVLGDKHTPPAIRDTFIKMKQSLVAEAYWQELAADRFSQAISKGTISPQNKTAAKYLLGQLYFRLGRHEEANRWLNEALVDRRLPENLTKWAKETQKRIR